MDLATRFNQSVLSRWINSSSGRIFRVILGLALLSAGIVYRDQWWGVAAFIWSVIPFTAGAGDLCYTSRALGGPLFGDEIREQQEIREWRV